METKYKVVIVTAVARIERQFDTQVEAITFKNEIEAGRKIEFYSISKVETRIEQTLPEGYH